jgi:hypothetical protein
METCCSCERTVKQCYDHLFEKYQCYLQYIPLPMELRYEIGKYLIRSDAHTIIYKRGMRPIQQYIHYDYDNDEQQEKRQLCTLCFQISIAESLCAQKCLPRFQRDKWYFIVYKYYSEHLELQHKKALTDFYLHYYLPKVYEITHNRQSLPSEHPTEKNKYIIYSKYNDINETHIQYNTKPKSPRVLSVSDLF